MSFFSPRAVRETHKICAYSKVCYTHKNVANFVPLEFDNTLLDINNNIEIDKKKMQKEVRKIGENEGFNYICKRKEERRHRGE